MESKPARLPSNMSTITLSSPVMSDKTLLLSVEDLISIAMGPRDGNIVNFKVLQTILHILARQMRVLEQKVILVVGDMPEKRKRSRGRGRGRGRGEKDVYDDYEAGGFRRRTPPGFSTEEEKLAWEKEEDAIIERRRLSRSRSDLRGRRSHLDVDEGGGRGRSGGRGHDEERGGRGRSGGRGSADEDYDRGGRGRSGGRHGSDRDDADMGRGRAGGHGGHDDDDRGGRGRSGGRGGGHEYDDSHERGGHGRSGGHGGGHDTDDSHDREGRDRSGGRGGGPNADDSHERGGRDRSGGRGGGHDIDDGHDRRGHDRLGGRGGGHDIDGSHERGSRDRSGGRGRGHDIDDSHERGGRDRSGGRGGGHDIDDGHDRRGHDRSGGRGGGHDIDDRSGGHGRYDSEEREGHGRSGGRGGDRHDDDRGGSDRSGGRHGGHDKDDDEHGGRGRAGGRVEHDRHDADRGGSDRAGGKHGGHGKDAEGGHGRSEGGREHDRDDEHGGRDRTGAGGRGIDKDNDGRGGRDMSGGREGTYRDDDRGGRDRAGGRGRGGEADEDRGRRGREGRDADEQSRRGGAGGGKGGRDDTGGKQGLGVREIAGPGKEKLLVVEKGPTTVGSARDRDSIAVVTQSQFQLLEEQVDELWRAAGPLPMPTMPDNKQLRQDLAAGASLTDAMQAMQVSARVQAAEQAIMKLGGLLTQLAASGVLPEDAADELMGGGWMGDDERQLKSASSGTAYKSIRVDPSAKQLGAGQAGQVSVLAGAKMPAAAKSSVMAAPQYITVPEMGNALGKLREDVTKAMEAQIERAAVAADAAEKTARSVGQKVDELLKMDARLNSMYSMVEDYSEQLNGFDAGLNTQMSSFKEQMTSLRAELQGGLEQLEASNSNPETAAVMELNERFEGLVHGLDDTLLQHKTLNDMQHQLTQELKTLVEGVEVLREQKADRDELLDILRDKADITMLEGLVRQAEFDRAQADLELRLEKCNDKFKAQDTVWMEAIQDLRDVSDTKAQLTDLMKVRDDATNQLRSIDDRINQLALLLGEPKAAMLMRKLARDAVCASCLAPALMDPGEAPAPPLLPAARPKPPEAPCVPEPQAPDYPDFRTHRCHRWVGGSHTLLPPARAHPHPVELPDVTRKYTGYGEDGRLYYLESECVPCLECNPEPAPAPPATARAAGAGDADDDGYCPCYDENDTNN